MDRLTHRARLALPYVSPPMSLNDRTHWAPRHRATREARDTAHLLAKSKKLPRGLNHVTVALHYQPATHRRRDTDNLVATLKPLCDGLVDYGLVADDTPDHMSKPEPVILPTVSGTSKAAFGRMWLDITWAGEGDPT